MRKHAPADMKLCVIFLCPWTMQSASCVSRFQKAFNVTLTMQVQACSALSTTKRRPGFGCWRTIHQYQLSKSMLVRAGEQKRLENLTW